MIRWLGKLLGIEGLESVENVRVQFAAGWAHQRPALVLFACVLAAGVSILFYLRLQTLRRSGWRMGMAIFRALLLALLVVVLAEPVIALNARHTPRPLLLFLFDGSDSMNIPDRLSPEAQQTLRKSLGPETPKFDDLDKPPTRQDLVRAAIRAKEGQWLSALREKFRCQGYVLDQPDQIREVMIPQVATDPIEPSKIADQIKGTAEVTALGAGLDDLRRRSRSHLLAGVVVVSDFNQNGGQPVLPAAKRLKVPIYAVGLGPREAADLIVDLQTPLVLKKGEKTAVTVLLRQTGLDGREAKIQLRARRMGTIDGAVEGEGFERVAPVKTVQLDRKSMETTIVYEPEVTGRFTLQAHVKPFEDEVLGENNSAEREVIIRDESLKLLFVENEPTWEWRFVKEVFYRHPMIGREGFRTYLDSADFMVRRGSDIFLETLVRSREEFFGYDIIFLSDVPSKMLSQHFQEMLREYVSKFGGGVVVLAGPRYGPTELGDTKIGDMLPVVVGQAPRRRDGEFALRLTPSAAKVDFMNLGDNERDNLEAWANLRKLQWYQPSLRPHPLATVLADHPMDKCVDGKTPQPLIAIRRYGKGEVVYFAFNEIWRLRRLYGEKYYSQFWGQLIYRMGLGRALGSQKRFRVQTDRHTYQEGQKVHITIEAYNRRYEPLQTDRLEARLLFRQSPTVAQVQERKLSIPLSREKVIFETSLPVFTTGLHRLLVKDPVTSEEEEVTFKVAPTSAERRSAVRNAAIQLALAEHTGGKAYELHEIADLARDIERRDVVEVTERRLPLWNTWLTLAVVLFFMLGEWLVRKLLNLQ